MNRPNAVWDIPTRCFHWAVVIGVGVAWWSAEQQRYDIHEWAGYTLLVLVVSRILWGLVGSRHSRFADFVAGPRRVVAYLRGTASATPGHNPLGGWSVLALLSLLLLQAVSGLFNSDDILYSGPLYYAVDGPVRDAMGELHEIAFTGLQVLVALHIAAVCYYQWVRRDAVLVAMLRGSAPGRVGREAPRSAWIALVIAALVAAALWYGLSQAPQPVSYW